MKAYRGKPRPPQLTEQGKALATKARHGEINVQAIGKALRSWKGRLLGGQRLMARTEKKRKVNEWRVEAVSFGGG